jgi:hypothetical protein
MLPAKVRSLFLHIFPGARNALGERMVSNPDDFCMYEVVYSGLVLLRINDLNLEVFFYCVY